MHGPAAAYIVFWAALALILYVYVGYPVLLLCLGALRRGRGSRRCPITPEVSLIISAYNEEGVIREKLLNSLNLDYPPGLLETVVASDGSTDRTTAIAAEYAAAGVTVYAFHGRRGKNAILNEVVPRVKGEIVVFTDANGKFQRQALRNLVGHFADARVGCVCGELIYASAGDNLVARGYDVYWRYDQHLKRLESRLSCLLGANGSIFAIRKHLYRPLPGEVCNDMVLAIQIAAQGYTVLYDPEAISLEAGSQGAREELQRRSRIVGRGILGIRTVLPDILRGRRFLLFWELMSRKFLRYCTPFLFLVLAVSNLFLATGMYAWVLAAQGLFYVLALLSYTLRRLGMPLRVLSIPHYFVLGNLAALLGWGKVLARRELAKWETVERTYDKQIPSTVDAPPVLPK